MGSYREIKGDLLELFDKGEFDIICHGANCHRLMDAGIAKQIKEKYPEAYYADLYFEIPEGMWRLGKYSCTIDGDIFNLYTQALPGPNASLEAITLSLRLFANEYNLQKDLQIGLPQIGCGIGSLKWKDVKPIIQEELKDFEVTVVFYDKVSS